MVHAETAYEGIHRVYKSMVVSALVSNLPLSNRTYECLPQGTITMNRE